MIHPKTELRFISNDIGHGVVATAFIPAGTITWALDNLDREFSPDTFKAMDALYQDILETYTFRNSNGNLVLCWVSGVTAKGILPKELRCDEDINVRACGHGG